MPFVQRNPQGQITAIFATASSPDAEWVDAQDEQIQSFLSQGGDQPAASFGGLDSDFIRVLEDVIDTLIDKNVLRLTDLPLEAQRKLLARKGLRHRMRDKLDLLRGNDVI